MVSFSFSSSSSSKNIFCCVCLVIFHWARERIPEGWTRGAAELMRKGAKQVECLEPLWWALELGANQSEAVGLARWDVNFSGHTCPCLDSPRTLDLTLQWFEMDFIRLSLHSHIIFFTWYLSYTRASVVLCPWLILYPDLSWVSSSLSLLHQI